MADTDSLDALTAKIKDAIATQAAVWEEEFDAGSGMVVGLADAAFVAARYCASKPTVGDVDLDAMEATIERNGFYILTKDQADALISYARSLESQLAESQRENERACEEAADTMRYLVPGDVGLDEWPEGCEDLPERLAKILAPAGGPR